MVDLLLPPNSRIDLRAGKTYPAPAGAKMVRRFRIYRYDPDSGERPRIDTFELDMASGGPMVLDALLRIKNEIDAILALRRSCPEGIWGSWAININGLNAPASTRPGEELAGHEIDIYPLPHMPVLKDLITDLTHFYAQYAS